MEPPEIFIDSGAAPRKANEIRFIKDNVEEGKKDRKPWMVPGTDECENFREIGASQKK